MDLIVLLVVVALAVLAVLGPLRREGRPDEEAMSAERAELEAAREAKYREIRYAELDHSTGKLPDADFEALERTLRAEAVEILHALDRARND